MAIHSSADVNLVTATAPAEYLEGRNLFSDYASRLGVDLCFQNFSEELDRLPEMYGPPSGRLILARADERYVGCVGVRALTTDPRACEMKRLYVSDAMRGFGVGRRLAAASIEAARQIGYERMVLDTLDGMFAARALYAELGFRETAPYYPNPNVGVKYLELEL